MADEDSEGALSRADSRADSRNDLNVPDAPDGNLNSSPLNTSKLSVSSEQEYDQPWVKGQGSASPQISPKLSEAAKVHQFQYKTFSLPHKCSYCTSILIGVSRQGISCRGKLSFERKIEYKKHRLSFTRDRVTLLIINMLYLYYEGRN